MEAEMIGWLQIVTWKLCTVQDLNLGARCRNCMRYHEAGIHDKICIAYCIHSNGMYILCWHHLTARLEMYMHIYICITYIVWCNYWNWYYFISPWTKFMKYGKIKSKMTAIAKSQLIWSNLLTISGKHPGDRWTLFFWCFCFLFLFFFAEGCGLLTIALAAELKQLDGVLVSFLQGKIFDTRWVIDWIMILH